MTARKEEKMGEFTTTIEWKNAEMERPVVSGKYLTINLSGTNMTTMPYSVRHNVFNAHDFESESEAKETVIKIAYWADIPQNMQDIMDDLWREFKKEDI